MDWKDKVITLVGQEDGHIYDCTIRVQGDKSYIGGNIISVDMRNILPKYKNLKKRAGHSMYYHSGLKECYNSWGNSYRVIQIDKNEPSAKYYSAWFGKIVRRGYQGRPDE